MKKVVYISGLFLLALLFSCETNQVSNDAVLSGKIFYIDENTQVTPVEGALVYSKTVYAQALTDAAGAYELTITPESDEQEIVIAAGKVGFDPKEITAIARKGETVLVPDITLHKQQSDTVIIPVDTLSSSGDAAHIEVAGNPDAHVYIQSSGLTETAAINFLITDAKGVPVDDTHKVNVRFSILNGPDGGEYLFPESMDTQGGYAYTFLNSGILAGAVQIEAQFDINGETIRALPIRVAIYGGLPDAGHFSIALDKVNIAGRVHFGLQDAVTAFVGDKFSNPVAPGTAVYFYSDYGIVEGSAVTDAMGRATARFMSASPLPPNPLTNPFAHIKAETFSDTLAQNKIETDTHLLLTDITAPIAVAPSGFTYNDSNTPVQFSYSVADIYGYPLVGGTQISVEATDGNLFGDISIRINDTQAKGAGTTDFSFTWAPGDSLDAPQVYINIKATPPTDGNGYQSTSLLGTKSN